ncbi:hypothetical protein Ddc_19435 [Ditylenchus destructor]|nr:hypothetical protein Ddc_19435 [Ditylenchus destructor]
MPKIASKEPGKSASNSTSAKKSREKQRTDEQPTKSLTQKSINSRQTVNEPGESSTIVRIPSDKFSAEEDISMLENIVRNNYTFKKFFPGSSSRKSSITKQAAFTELAKKALENIPIFAPMSAEIKRAAKELGKAKFKEKKLKTLKEVTNVLKNRFKNLKKIISNNFGPPKKKPKRISQIEKKRKDFPMWDKWMLELKKCMADQKKELKGKRRQLAEGLPIQPLTLSTNTPSQNNRGTISEKISTTQLHPENLVLDSFDTISSLVQTSIGTSASETSSSSENNDFFNSGGTSIASPQSCLQSTSFSNCNDYDVQTLMNEKLELECDNKMLRHERALEKQELAIYRKLFTPECVNILLDALSRRPEEDKQFLDSLKQNSGKLSDLVIPIKVDEPGNIEHEIYCPTDDDEIGNIEREVYCPTVAGVTFSMQVSKLFIKERNTYCFGWRVVMSCLPSNVSTTVIATVNFLPFGKIYCPAEVGKLVRNVTFKNDNEYGDMEWVEQDWTPEVWEKNNLIEVVGQDRCIVFRAQITVHTITREGSEVIIFSSPEDINERTPKVQFYKLPETSSPEIAK